MKIIQILSTIKSNLWGGTEAVSLEYAKALQRAGHEVAIYAAPKLSSIIEKQIQNIKIRRLLPFPPYCLDFQRKPDILHWHHGQRMGNLTMQMSKRYNIPYFITVHGGVDSIRTLANDGQIDASHVQPKMKSFYEQANCIFTVGGEEYNLAKEIFPHQNIVYFPNGVDLKHFTARDGSNFRKKYDIPENSLLLLCMARIDRIKNQHLLLRAFAQINSIIGKKIYLALVGTPVDLNYYHQIQQEILELKIENNIRFITKINPFIPEHAEAYAAANLFILPSISESCPVVIPEAWASKKPVIASNVGGIPYLIEDNKTGILFESNNQQDLVQKIIELIHNPTLAQTLKEEGYKKAQGEYSWDSIGKKLEQLYRDAIDIKKKARLK